ncbi:hypothetical protein C8J56DRAFT_937145 [Mycena floridula]|nr:hypothetical protein C8J56DRAFT_937145 [Mycena floridula]
MPLPALSIDLWESIAYYALTGESAFFGPPAGLSAICLISRSVYGAIRFDTNSRLYARLFCFKFDYAAPSRRLSHKWRNTRGLAQEFKKRVITLKRIRKREELNVDDLWTCYLMMLENDGHNERQLVEWAILYQYIHKFTIIRYQASRDDESSWFQNTEVTALTLWLWWLIFFPEALARESSSTRDALTGMLLPELMYAGFMYPSIHAPDAYFQLPLPPQDHPISETWTPPRVVTVCHYGHPLTLSAPLLTPIALLVGLLRIQIYIDAEPFDPSSLPGPRIQDIVEFRNIRIKAPERCRLVVDEVYDDFPDGKSVDQSDVLQGSRRYDEDWHRLVSCYDPFEKVTPLRGIVYRIGSLVGSWAGRFLQTSFDVHTSIILNPKSFHNKPAPQMYPYPLYWNLQEHHCLHPSSPLDPSTDDFLHAWIPRGSDIVHVEDAVEVLDPRTRQKTRYETYRPRGMAGAPYSRSVCEKLQSSGHLGDWEEISDEMTSTNVDISNQTKGKRRIQLVTDRQSGIADILVTGSTGARHGAAWGYFDIIGRVRPWDGLVILLRTPRNPEQSYLGTWIFRGYVHNQNFVGRWRETSTAANLIGYEGGFVVSKIEESSLDEECWKRS